ncbi:hypothetical protein TWF481_003058 [Arthrobotrys musiformis]|uniref:F-box domain-containing protein n=1 Tax=Arthrobotrys musiformis TaxID=47236 RepID=A0AAV9VP73_9PEZI
MSRIARTRHYTTWFSTQKQRFSQLIRQRKGCPILALPLDIKLHLLASVPDSQTLFSLAKTCKPFYDAFTTHETSLLRSARLKELYANRLFLAGYAVNCLWKDSTWRTRSRIRGTCAYIRKTYFSTDEFGPSGEPGSLAGLVEQLEDNSSRLRTLMRSHDPAVDVSIDGMGTSPDFFSAASQAVDVLHELVDRFWIFWNRLPLEDRNEFYDSYLVTRRIVLRSILGMWILRILQAESGPYPPATLLSGEWDREAFRCGKR